MSNKEVTKVYAQEPLKMNTAPQLHKLAAMYSEKQIWSCHQGPTCSICDAKAVGKEREYLGLAMYQSQNFHRAN
ncbi:Protein CBG26194 [Caenorhabditis briggsae]|uniref:Protein CBG26194 n=1 Tax=Caenorhabditis briggsae TaxID=6238 RepID=B6ILT9_CAEBR|nr:Protein CBG26194 [Caenorhabditis briggsae]CAS00869.1 Protein CBG26194 [Caenorhabditis briggsae]